jgi:mono/diheme cytochrome c family protein
MTRGKWLLAGVGLVVIGMVVAGWYHLFRQVPRHYASIEEHFKYGSVGVEAANGIPYWVWLVLPRVFPDKIGADGYRSFGFIFEEKRDHPIGTSVMTVGFPRLGINCGLCHVGSVRASESEPQKLLVGAPNTTLDLQRYLRFLFACANDPRFTADNILSEIALVHDLSLVERLLYRFAIIPQMRRALREQARDVAWMDRFPDWGPGRVDPFNPAKVQITKRPFDGTIGAADIVALWNFRPRRDFGLHWDGLNTSLKEIFLNSGIGNGASNRTIDLKSLDRIQQWVLDLKPAAYPYEINRELAGRGERIFAAQCAGCHAFGAEKVGRPIPLARIGTDRHRLDSWSEEAAAAFNNLDDYRWRYTHFRKTDGYVAVPLDGIWARAPYLHNGSVPTLWDLLAAPDKRPARFYRGLDVYDPTKVGFVSDQAAPVVVAGAGAVTVRAASTARAGRLFDTAQPGNGNHGHVFGTTLPDADKWALIEYLKTL